MPKGATAVAYKQLEEENGEVLGTGARISFTSPPAVVRLNSLGQHALEWDVDLNSDGVSVPAGSLNLYTYPGRFDGTPELMLVRKIMLELARNHTHLFEVPDPVGAYIIHALIVCNTEASLELSFAILVRALRTIHHLSTTSAPPSAFE